MRSIGPKSRYNALKFFYQSSDIGQISRQLQGTQPKSDNFLSATAPKETRNAHPYFQG